MKTHTVKWQSLALFGFFSLMTFGAFAQSAQPTEAHYMTPMTCSQLKRVCDMQMERGARPRACSMYATLCDWVGSSSSSNSCGPSAILCPPNRMPECSNGRWRCAAFSSSSSASSVSSVSMNCATTQVLCIAGTTAKCINDQWQCLPNGSSSSTDACIARCPDGYHYRTCTEEGHPINYLVDPCLGRYGSSSSSSSSAALCEESLCGPRMGMPNWICPDGNSYGGPTGRCLRQQSGACGWQVLSCPATSSVSSSSSTSSLSTSSSSQSLGCYCTKIYKPVCGTDGKTYGNECEAGCASAGVSHEGRCRASSSAVSIRQCPVYSLMTPGYGCRYVYEKDVRGCDVPRLVCSVSSSSSSSVSSSRSSSAQSVGAQAGCKVGGCSGQLCVEEGNDGISTCEWREEYACYRTARCERQTTGVCGWTQTQELRSCISNARS